MRKTRLLKHFFLLFALIVGAGNAWAVDKWVKTAPSDLQTGDIVVIVDQTSSKAMSNNNGTSAPSATTVTLNSDKSEISSTVSATLQWEVTKDGDSFQFGVSGDYLYVTNTNNGVKVGSGARNTFTIVTGGDNGGYYLYNGDSDDSRYVGCYSQSDWRCYGSINNNIKGNNNAFYKKTAASGAVDPTVTISSTTLTVGGTATISGPSDLSMSFETSDNSVASVDADGVVTGVAVGEATITATWDAVANTYNAGSQEFTVTVADATVYEKVTDASQLVAGNEYILVATGSNVAMGAQDSKLRKYVTVTINDNKVEITDEAVAVLTLGGSTGAWTFLASDNSQYLALTANSNEVHASNDATLSTSKWTITDDFQLQTDAQSDTRYLRYNSGSPRFACYKSGQVVAVLFVKSGGSTDEKLEPGYSFSATSAEATLGEDFTAPTFNNPNGISVTFDSSDKSVATISATGEVEILAGGSTTISASSEADETYKEGYAYYTLTVIDPDAPGTENNPYTVAQARAAIDAGVGTQGVYAKGIVSKIVTPYDSQYGNISYNISADGTTTADQLEAYRGKSYNGVEFTSEDDIQVGDEVVIYGNLKKYTDGTYEFAADNQLVSLIRNTVTIDADDISIAYDATSGTINYTITNPVDDGELTAALTAYCDWLALGSIGETIPFTVTNNPNGTSRFATVRLTYTYHSSITITKEVKITQAPNPNVVMTIAEVRAQESGEVNTRGVVTSYVGSTAFIQDGTAAICVYGANLGLTVGDEIIVAGTLSTYNGLLEIKDPDITVSSSGNEVTASVKTIAEIVADYNGSNGLQGWLVKIEDAVVNAVDGQKITIAQGNNTIMVAGVPSNITVSVNNIVTVIGNIGSYNDVRIVNPSDVYLKPTITIDPLTYDLNSLNQSGTVEVGYTNIDFTNSLEVVFLDVNSSPTTYNWITAQINSSNHNISFNVEANNGAETRIAYLKVLGYDKDGEEVYSGLVTIRQSAASVAATGYYKKVTSAADITSGQYLIVYEGDASHSSVAFNGGLETLDVANNTIAVSIESGKITASETTNAAEFTIDVTAGTLMSASGKYIGVSANSNGLKTSDDPATYTNSFGIDTDGNAVIAAVFSASSMTLRYNYASNQARFRYYSNYGQQAIQLYKYVEFVAPAHEYITFCSTKALDFTQVDGLDTYIVTKVNETSVSIQKIEAAVPAGTGLILKKTGTVSSFEVPVVAEATAPEGNLLTGVTKPTLIGNTTATDYILFDGKFYPASQGTLPAGKAYLRVDNTNAPELGLDYSGETTGIGATLNDNGEMINDNVYDLSGRRVENPTNGIYIINGRKVVVK